jgi:hypothetical protein
VIGIAEAPQRFFRAVLLAAGLGLGSVALAPAASAQVDFNPQHDVTGPLTTSSEIGGRVISPDALAPTLRAATLAALEAAYEGGLVGPGGEAIPDSVQVRTWMALEGVHSAVTELAEALGLSEDHPLMRELAGLVATPNPQRFARALARFNEYVDAAPPAFLSAPPPRFLAVWAILERIVAELPASSGEALRR